MRFEEAYGGWQESRLTRKEAERIPGVSDRTFRCYVERYEETGFRSNTPTMSSEAPLFGLSPNKSVAGYLRRHTVSGTCIEPGAHCRMHPVRLALKWCRPHKR